MTTTTIKDSQDLLNYLVQCAGSGQKNWFGYLQQRIAGIHLAYEVAANHADTMSPEDVVEYVVRLNNAIYHKLLKGDGV